MAKIKGADGKPCWDGYRYAGTVSGKDRCIKVAEIEEKHICDACAAALVTDIKHGKLTDTITEAEYQGRKVTLNKPIRTGPDEPKKFKVYVKDPATGNVKMVRFGHQGGGVNPDSKTLSIKKSDPDRRRSFRARHNCDTPGPKTKARYWSCKMW
jgi:hypothetical protein